MKKTPDFLESLKFDCATLIYTIVCWIELMNRRVWLQINSRAAENVGYKCYSKIFVAKTILSELKPIFVRS